MKYAALITVGVLVAYYLGLHFIAWFARWTDRNFERGTDA